LPWGHAAARKRPEGGNMQITENKKKNISALSGARHAKVAV
jgi:hypothetical protein